MNENQLITFGQLLKIKREQMDLPIYAVNKEIGISALSDYERDKYKPGKEILTKLIAFYKITEEEMKACKPVMKQKKINILSVLNTTASPKKQKISEILSLLGQVLQEVSKIDEKGILAQKMKKDSLENLKKAHELISDVLIIDRII